MARNAQVNAAEEGAKIALGGDGRWPAHLWACEREELQAAGLGVDTRGRIRDGDGNYVCAVSGRVHRKYLLRRQIPNGETAAEGGRWRDIWVSGHEVRNPAEHAMLRRMIDVVVG